MDIVSVVCAIRCFVLLGVLFCSASPMTSDVEELHPRLDDVICEDLTTEGIEHHDPAMQPAPQLPSVESLPVSTLGGREERTAPSRVAEGVLPAQALSISVQMVTSGGNLATVPIQEVTQEDLETLIMLGSRLPVVSSLNITVLVVSRCADELQDETYWPIVLFIHRSVPAQISWSDIIVKVGLAGTWLCSHYVVLGEDESGFFLQITTHVFSTSHRYSQRLPIMGDGTLLSALFHRSGMIVMNQVPSPEEMDGSSEASARSLQTNMTLPPHTYRRRVASRDSDEVLCCGCCSMQ